MATLNADETTKLLDAVLLSGAAFVVSKNNALTDADIKKLMVKRAVRMGTQRTKRGYDPNLQTRIVISMTGNV
jgi:hypothetical protein